MFRDFPVTKIVAELEYDDLLPGILFRTSRKQCDDDIIRLAGSRIGKVGPGRRRALAAAVREVMNKYSMDDEVILDHPHYEALIATACGAHHAGQLLMWRLLLEELMTKNLLKLMIATGTVAAGVDFPARSVVITAHSKRGSEGFNTLSSAEFQQMSGRAGRRGKDTVGLCIIAPGQFSDARVISKVSKQPPEPLRSAYFASPSTVLNLLKFRNVDDLKYTVSKSLAVFLDRKEAEALREKARELENELKNDEQRSADKVKKGEKRARRWLRKAQELEERQEQQLQASLDGLMNLGFLEEGGLTEKGYWAAELCTGLVLQLAEAIEEGIFYDLSELELAALVASVAGDAHRVYFSLTRNPIKEEYYAQLKKIVERVKDRYHGPSNSSEVQVLPDAALTVIAWMEADSWTNFSGLLRLAGVAEGDASRIITQAADHLHQISRLFESHPDLARTAASARRVLLRPPFTEGLLIE